MHERRTAKDGWHASLRRQTDGLGVVFLDQLWSGANSAILGCGGVVGPEVEEDNGIFKERFAAAKLGGRVTMDNECAWQSERLDPHWSEGGSGMVGGNLVNEEKHRFRTTRKRLSGKVDLSECETPRKRDSGKVEHGELTEGSFWPVPWKLAPFRDIDMAQEGQQIRGHPLIRPTALLALDHLVLFSVSVSFHPIQRTYSSQLEAFFTPVSPFIPDIQPLLLSFSPARWLVEVLSHKLSIHPSGRRAGDASPWLSLLKPHTIASLSSCLLSSLRSTIPGWILSQLSDYMRGRERRSYVAKDESRQRACLSVPIKPDAEGWKFMVEGRVSLQMPMGLRQPEPRPDQMVDSGRPQCSNGFEAMANEEGLHAQGGRANVKANPRPTDPLEHLPCCHRRFKSQTRTGLGSARLTTTKDPRCSRTMEDTYLCFQVSLLLTANVTWDQLGSYAPGTSWPFTISNPSNKRMELKDPTQHQRRYEGVGVPRWEECGLYPWFCCVRLMSGRLVRVLNAIFLRAVYSNTQMNWFLVTNTSGSSGQTSSYRLQAMVVVKSNLCISP
ncbi:hypothetical protein BKA70DRAFT_1404887 [Coprinopsis sp. MPI-PUGE-AT-0042]|nr:hypothetical protein BKA70DRAFT_1404887 [Coprinopsis sp. MPI-PUGE-AT-0042]